MADQTSAEARALQIRAGFKLYVPAEATPIPLILPLLMLILML